MDRWLWLLALTPLVHAADADSAVLDALRREASGLPHAAIIKRVAADGGLDVVAALASRQACEAAPRPCGWSPQDRLGIFVQERRDPGRVYKLVVAPGPNDDCSARVERMTAQELVLSCTGEKWATYDNQKFVYDAGRKALVSQFAYAPFWTVKAARGPRGGPQLVMADNQKLLLVDLDPATGSLRVAPAAEARPVLAQVPMENNRDEERILRMPAPEAEAVTEFGPGGRFRLAREKNKYGSEYTVIAGPGGKQYPLMQSGADPAEMNEQVGPHQVEGWRLWFGKTFYSDEGLSGVGGFGYFDAASASYRLVSPPEIRKWSVSAILVEPECVWLALYQRGEYGNYPGALLRWDRKTATARQFAVQTVVTVILESGGTLYLGAIDGIVTVKGEQVASYFVDARADGQYRVVQR
ncbi:MAG: hypothetical protein ABSB88_04455 [Bryobacteraceae bacterium]|jgi:hypothetical protein